MKFQIKAVIPVFLTVINFGAISEQKVGAISQKQVCEPVAKIISGDARYKPLSKLCEQDKVNPTNGRSVQVFCYLRGVLLDIPGDSVGKHCLPLPKADHRGCTMLSGRNCFEPKGRAEERVPRLITPYGLVIINSRPNLSWTAIDMATSYNIQVKGTGVDWEAEVKGNTLPYPQDKPAIEPGNIYTVNIIAIRNNELLVGKASPLILLSEEKTQKVTEIINILASLNQSPDELAIDMDAVYEARNLLNNSIEVLTARAKAGSSNPKIYRLLGDRYLIAKLVNQANEAYVKAEMLSQNSNNILELAKAQAGIEIVQKYINHRQE